MIFFGVCSRLRATIVSTQPTGCSAYLLPRRPSCHPPPPPPSVLCAFCFVLRALPRAFCISGFGLFSSCFFWFARFVLLSFCFCLFLAPCAVVVFVFRALCFCPSVCCALCVVILYISYFFRVFCALGFARNASFLLFGSCFVCVCFRVFRPPDETWPRLGRGKGGANGGLL